MKKSMRIRGWSPLVLSLFFLASCGSSQTNTVSSQATSNVELKATVSSSLVLAQAPAAGSGEGPPPSEQSQTILAPFQCDVTMTRLDGSLLLTKQVIQDIKFLGSGPLNGETISLLSTFLDPSDPRINNGFQVQVDCRSADAGFVERFFNSWSDSLSLNFDSDGRVSHTHSLTNPFDFITSDEGLKLITDTGCFILLPAQTFLEQDCADLTPEEKAADFLCGKIARLVSDGIQLGACGIEVCNPSCTPTSCSEGTFCDFAFGCCIVPEQNFCNTAWCVSPASCQLILSIEFCDDSDGCPSLGGGPGVRCLGVDGLGPGQAVCNALHDIGAPESQCVLESGCCVAP